MTTPPPSSIDTHNGAPKIVKKKAFPGLIKRTATMISNHGNNNSNSNNSHQTTNTSVATATTHSQCIATTNNTASVSASQNFLTQIHTSKYVNSKVFHKNVPDSLRELPPFIHQCMRYIEDQCLDVEGIFRLSAQVNILEGVISELENSEGRYVIPLEQYNRSMGPHVAANLLKLYFRELKDPLLSFENYDMFIAVSAMDDNSAVAAANKFPAKKNQAYGGGGGGSSSEEDESVASMLARAKQEKIKHVLQFLPKGHFTILSQLCHFLYRITKNQAQNKMNAHNLAIVFAPNILRTNQVQSTEDLIKDTKFSNSLMTEFIRDPDFYFPGGDMMSVMRMDDQLNRVFTDTNTNSNSSNIGSSSNGSNNGSSMMNNQTSHNNNNINDNNIGNNNHHGYKSFGSSLAHPSRSTTATGTATASTTGTHMSTSTASSTAPLNYAASSGAIKIATRSDRFKRRISEATTPNSPSEDVMINNGSGSNGMSSTSPSSSMVVRRKADTIMMKRGSPIAHTFVANNSNNNNTGNTSVDHSTNGINSGSSSIVTAETPRRGGSSPRSQQVASANSSIPSSIVRTAQKKMDQDSHMYTNRAPFHMDSFDVYNEEHQRRFVKFKFSETRYADQDGELLDMEEIDDEYEEEQDLSASLQNEVNFQDPEIYDLLQDHFLR